MTQDTTMTRDKDLAIDTMQRAIDKLNVAKLAVLGLAYKGANGDIAIDGAENESAPVEALIDEVSRVLETMRDDLERKAA
jgi:hypothetical protein